MIYTLNRALVIGAGAVGKCTAAHLALSGVKVRLFEFDHFITANHQPHHIEILNSGGHLKCTGEISGDAALEHVTSDMAVAMDADIDYIFICTVSEAHTICAMAIAPYLDPNRHVVVLHPGSTGGALLVAKVWRQAGHETVPPIVELNTSFYGCRASGIDCNFYLRVKRCAYGVLPVAKNDGVMPPLLKVFGKDILWRAPDSLAAGLVNANPIIHPAITVLNVGRMEQQGTDMLFYADGASPLVCNMIEALDKERLALIHALGYDDPEQGGNELLAMPDHENCVKQGYAKDYTTYHSCYGAPHGTTAFSMFSCPPNKEDHPLTKHRYFEEDVGHGLVLYHQLGKQLGVPTPIADAVITLSNVICKKDFLAAGTDVVSGHVSQLGIEGLDVKGIREYVATGVRPVTTTE